MSMLAERRRKTKWVINPTKKPIWTTDSEGIKLGKQLMEKMGWSAGKGLGAKEQGIQEPLKVSYKNDTKGMGFKGNDEDWMEHQDEFNSLLSQLSSSDPSKSAELDKNEIKSLEEKSKHSRARVHYQKFTRGKDLSRYSETDLACILGINHSKKQKNSLEEKNPVEEKTDGSYETSFGVTTINSGSILDYFKKKWTIGKSNENNSSKSLDGLTEESINNTEGFKLTSEPKKTKKRKLDEVDGENQQVPEDKTIKTEEVENSEIGGEVKKTKKSKKQKHNELSGGNPEVPENEIIEGSEEVDNFCNLELGKERKKHKKSKKKKKEDLNIEYGNVSEAHQKENYDADNNNKIEEDNKDIKFTGGVENVIDDNNLSLGSKKYEPLQLLREISQNGDDDLKRKRKKDKKKHKIKELDTPEENVEEDFDHRIKKKKKKDKEKKEKDNVTQNEINKLSGENCLDKDKSESKSISNGDERIEKLDLIEDTAMTNAVDSPSEKSRKEKRRKEKHRLDQSTPGNDEELKIKSNIAVGEVESESKSRRRKEKLTDQALVENEEEQKKMNESLLEEVEPVVREKKKKRKYKSDESKLENEKEEETETKITSEEVEESKIKEKKKKSKHRSDQSTLEKKEEQVTKSKRVPEEVEPEITEKKSKKGKSSEGKKSKHKTGNEGLDESNINSESVQENNDDINTTQKQSEKSKKVDVDTKVKEDCKNLVKENEPKQNESKTEYDSRIHSHKVELFKKKKNISLLGAFPKNSPNNRVMGLIFGAEFEKFKGSNIEKLVGYGMQKKSQDKCDG